MNEHTFGYNLTGGVADVGRTEGSEPLANEVYIAGT